MNPNAPVRILITIVLLIINVVIVFGKDKYNKFEQACFVLALTYTAYFCLKEVFGF